MNNSQFRSLLSSSTPTTNRDASSPTTIAMRPPTLGSRARSSIPMTPRTVHGGSSSIDFRRQLSDLNGEPPTKKFKSSGPRGVKLGRGYVDRSQALREGGEARNGDDEGENSKAERLKNLEEMYKLQQIDAGMLERMRRELGVGGNVETSHLVKGLDWELLKRVRDGEDVLAEPTKEGNQEAQDEQMGEGDVEDELDGVLGHDVQAKSKDDTSAYAPEDEANTVETEVLSRDEILRRLKASRSAPGTAMAPPPVAALNDRFKKVGSGWQAEKNRFTEIISGRRREVLLTTDKEGKPKRKVRWLDPPGTQVQVQAEDQVKKEVLGMEVPAEIAARQKALLEQQRAEEEEDDDIFAGVGAAYDPLAGIGSDDEDSDAEEKQQEAVPSNAEMPTEKEGEKRRNYFGDVVAEDEESHSKPANDPTIMAALKRAAALRQAEAAGKKDSSNDEDQEEHDPERALKRKAFLERLKQEQRDDARDLDMGFGDSRYGDAEEEGDEPLFDGSGDEKKERKEKRKRAPKKRKGDKDNVKDVLGVLEGRKGGK